MPTIGELNVELSVLFERVAPALATALQQLESWNAQAQKLGAIKLTVDGQGIKQGVQGALALAKAFESVERAALHFGDALKQTTTDQKNLSSSTSKVVSDFGQVSSSVSSAVSSLGSINSSATSASTALGSMAGDVARATAGFAQIGGAASQAVSGLGTISQASAQASAGLQGAAAAASGTATALRAVPVAAAAAVAGLGAIPNAANAAGAGFTSLQRQAQGLQQIGLLIAGVGAAATAGIGLSIKAFADFDLALQKSVSVQRDIKPADRSDLGNAAIDLSKTIAVSAKDAAAAFYPLQSIGFNVKEQIAGIGKVAQFAQAGLVDMATAAQDLTRIQGALGLATGDSASKLQSIQRISDLIVKADTTANARTAEFAEALVSKGAPAIRQYGQTLEDGVAVLAAFAEGGVRGAQAGNFLAITLRELDRGFVKQKSNPFFEAFNVHPFDEVTGKARSLIDVIDQMQKHFRGLSDEQKLIDLGKLLPGSRSLNAILPILNDSERGVRFFGKAMQDVGGLTKEVSDNQMKAFANQMQLLENRVTALKIALGDALAHALLGLGTLFSPVLRVIEAAVAAFRSLPSEVQAVVGAFVILGTGAVVATGLLTVLAASAIRTAASLQILSNAGTSSVFSGLIGKFGAVAAQTALAGSSTIAYGRTLASLGGTATAASSAVFGAASAAATGQAAALSGLLAVARTVGGALLGIALPLGAAVAIGIGIKKLGDYFVDASGSAERLAANLREPTDSLKKISDQVDKLSGRNVLVDVIIRERRVQIAQTHDFERDANGNPVLQSPNLPSQRKLIPAGVKDRLLTQGKQSLEPFLSTVQGATDEVSAAFGKVTSKANAGVKDFFESINKVVGKSQEGLRKSTADAENITGIHRGAKDIQDQIDAIATLKKAKAEGLRSDVTGKLFTDADIKKAEDNLAKSIHSAGAAGRRAVAEENKELTRALGDLHKAGIEVNDIKFDKIETALANVQKLGKRGFLAPEVVRQFEAFAKIQLNLQKGGDPDIFRKIKALEKDIASPKVELDVKEAAFEKLRLLFVADKLSLADLNISLGKLQEAEQHLDTKNAEKLGKALGDLHVSPEFTTVASKRLAALRADLALIEKDPNISGQGKAQARETVRFVESGDEDAVKRSEKTVALIREVDEAAKTAVASGNLDALKIKVREFQLTLGLRGGATSEQISHLTLGLEEAGKRIRGIPALKEINEDLIALGVRKSHAELEKQIEILARLRAAGNAVNKSDLSRAEVNVKRLKDREQLNTPEQQSIKTAGVQSTLSLKVEAADAVNAWQDALSHIGDATGITQRDVNALWLIMIETNARLTGRMPKDVDSAYNKINRATRDVVRQGAESFRAFSHQVSTILTDFGKNVIDILIPKSTSRPLVRETAAVADFAIQTGLSGDALESLVKKLETLTTATGGSFGSIAKDAAAEFKAWGIATKDQAANLDAIFATAVAGKTNFSELLASVAASATTFQALGLNASQAAALIAQLNVNGSDSKQVVDDLTRAYQDLTAKGYAKAGEALQQVIASIRNAGSVAEANAIAIRTFGTNGAAMATIIRAGKLDIDAFAASIAKAPANVNNAAGAVANFVKESSKLSTIIALFNEIGRSIARAFVEVGARAIATMIVSMVNLNNLFEKLLHLLAKLPGGLGGVFDTLHDVIFQTKKTKKAPTDDPTATDPTATAPTSSIDVSPITVLQKEQEKTLKDILGALTHEAAKACGCSGGPSGLPSIGIGLPGASLGSCFTTAGGTVCSPGGLQLPKIPTGPSSSGGTLASVASLIQSGVAIAGMIFGGGAGGGFGGSRGASSAFPGAGGAGSLAGSLGSQLGSALGGTISGFASAITGIIGVFQQASANKNISKTEESTRRVDIATTQGSASLDPELKGAQENLSTFAKFSFLVQRDIRDRLESVRDALFHPLNETLESIDRKITGFDLKQIAASVLDLSGIVNAVRIPTLIASGIGGPSLAPGGDSFNFAIDLRGSTISSTADARQLADTVARNIVDTFQLRRGRKGR